MKDLSGVWKCNGDGMTYTIKQIGTNLFVNGVGNSCVNVCFGTINQADNTVVLEWADMPSSRGNGNQGICFLDASVDGVITKKAGSPQYGIGNFQKVN